MVTGTSARTPVGLGAARRGRLATGLLGSALGIDGRQLLPCRPSTTLLELLINCGSLARLTNQHGTIDCFRTVHPHVNLCL